MENIELDLLSRLNTDKGVVYIGLDPYMDFDDIKAQGYTAYLVRVRRCSSFRDEPNGEIVKEAKSFFSNEYPKGCELYYKGDAEKFKEKYIYPLLKGVGDEDSESLDDIKRALDEMIDSLREIETVDDYRVIRIRKDGSWKGTYDKWEDCMYRYLYKYYIAIKPTSNI